MISLLSYIIDEVWEVARTVLNLCYFLMLARTRTRNLEHKDLSIARVVGKASQDAICV